ncbi:right-handed parallel beta-helix repeat-containing protein [Pontiellaceae bacterium B1224]|nr:right-handed parallel beta-helix repeat-containing protein [Pontiellaceae bacterium B1224]
MGMGKWICAGLILANVCVASDLSQKYEKAYFLETAKGQTEEALDIYREIAATPATDENRQTIIQSLKRMLAINEAVEKKNQRAGKPESKMELYRRGEKNLARGMDILQGSKVAEYSGEEEKLFTAAEVIFNQLLVMEQDQGEPGVSYTDRVTRPMVLKQIMEIAHKNANLERVAELQAKLIKMGEPITSVISHSPDRSEAVLFLPKGRHLVSNTFETHAPKGARGNLLIKGSGRDECVIEGTLDRSMFHVKLGGKASFESLTLKHQRESAKSTHYGCYAIWVDGGSVMATNCAFVALGNNSRSGTCVQVADVGKATFRDCNFRGFNTAVFLGRGSTEGHFERCVFRNAHSGIDMDNGAVLTVNHCIVTGATKTGVAGFGDKIRIANSLFIENREGIQVYSDRAEIVENGFINNQEYGIKVNKISGVAIRNNIFSHNHCFAIHAFGDGDSSFIEHNILADNGCDVGLTDRKEGFAPLNNTTWNEASTEEQLRFINMGEKNTSAAPNAPIKDPQFQDAINGDFTPLNPKVIEAGRGLSDPAVIKALWAKYAEAAK